MRRAPITCVVADGTKRSHGRIPSSSGQCAAGADEFVSLQPKNVFNHAPLSRLILLQTLNEEDSLVEVNSRG